MTKEAVIGTTWSNIADAPLLQTPGLNLSILCQCSCNGDAPIGGLPREDCGFSPSDALGEHVGEFCVEAAAPPVVAHAPSTSPAPKPPGERCLVSYRAALNLPLTGPPTRVGEVLHVLPEDNSNNFETVTLSLHVNGFAIMPVGSRRPPLFLAWSPFSLVQACRLHTTQADAAMPWLRLFKVSVFHHGATHFFAVQGDGADAERARWVADIARAIRNLTQSLFPAFSITTSPLIGARWTATRLMAGFMVMCNNQDVCLAYCELHAQRDCEAAFVAYKDAYCDARIVHCNIAVSTAISERVGVDCSCFSVDGHHFCTRSSAEKTLWLRAISNVKVKLRHNAGNPTEMELAHYRTSIQESIDSVKSSSDHVERCALLPRLIIRRQVPAVIAERSHSRSNNDTVRQELVGGRSQPAAQRSSVPCENIVQGDDEATVITLNPPRASNSQNCPVVQDQASRLGKPVNLPGAKLRGPASKPPQLPELDEGFDLRPDSARTNGSSDGSMASSQEDSKISPVSEAKYSPSKLPDDSDNLVGGHRAFPIVASEHLPVTFIM